MIAFFRRIRHQLLNQNRLGKYLLYAIGEIVLVVIGILIALQINNANEARKARIVENDYLERLLVDLKENEALWEDRIDREEMRREAAIAILNYSLSKEQDSVQKVLPYFNSVGNWSSLQINEVTFNEMVSSGTLNIISNDSIKLKILALDRLNKAITRRAQGMEENLLHRLGEVIFDQIDGSSVFVIDNLEDDLLDREYSTDELESLYQDVLSEFKALFTNKDFINMLILIEANTPLIVGEFEEASGLVAELIQLIEHEIQNKTE